MGFENGYLQADLDPLGQLKPTVQPDLEKFRGASTRRWETLPRTPHPPPGRLLSAISTEENSIGRSRSRTVPSALISPRRTPSRYPETGRTPPLDLGRVEDGGRQPQVRGSVSRPRSPFGH